MSPETAGKPRVGIPYRTRKEELASDRSRYELYVEAVRRAGGEPVEVSLGLSASQLADLVSSLDAFVLPGSPADVDPARYGTPRHPKCAEADVDRERTDFALLAHAFAEQKPVLAICYGIQSLNVFLGGSLVQDISSELDTPIQHEWERKQGGPEPVHTAHVESRSRLFDLAGSAAVRVNSSHHQSVQKPGRDLRVTALAPDGVIEAVEWTGDRNLVVGVQWHPERMVESDRLARALFEKLVETASAASVQGRVPSRR
jgi:putative glutamine amidotransferase